jgi:hypothetical protein
VTDSPTPTVTPPVWACDTCADRGEVAIILESSGGPRRKTLPCPDCGGSPLEFAAARDTAIGKLHGELKTQAHTIGLVILCIGLTVGILAVIVLRLRKLETTPIINLTDIGGEVL